MSNARIEVTLTLDPDFIKRVENIKNCENLKSCMPSKDSSVNSPSDPDSAFLDALACNILLFNDKTKSNVPGDQVNYRCTQACK